MQKYLNSPSPQSYMLKPYHLLTQGFENNKTGQKKLFKHMCNSGARAECRQGGRVVSSYLDVDTTKQQFRILNLTPLDCIAGHVIEYDVGDSALKRLYQIRLKFIDDIFQVTVLFLTHPNKLIILGKQKRWRMLCVIWILSLIRFFLSTKCPRSRCSICQQRNILR